MATLGDLGLSEYEARVYRSLLRTGPTTAKELSHASDVPMGRIYDILNNLTATDMVRSQNAGRPKKYAPVRPETALDRLLEDRREELDAELRQYESAVEELTDQLDAADRDEQFWTVAVGPSDTVDLLAERLAAANDRIVMVQSTPSPQFDLGDVGVRIANELASALDRGVKVSVLVTPDLMEAIPDSILQRYTESVGSHEAFEVRLTDHLDGSFNLIDRVEVCIGVSNPLSPGEAFALIDLTDPAFVANVYEEFRPRWEQAEPLSF